MASIYFRLLWLLSIVAIDAWFMVYAVCISYILHLFFLVVEVLISALLLQMLPSGDWHCPNCTCKFCGYTITNVAEENDSADNELNRCSFCEKKCNSIYVAVVMFAAFDLSLSSSRCIHSYSIFSILIWEFFYLILFIDHKSCSEKTHALPMSSNGVSFCGLKCQEVLA